MLAPQNTHIRLTAVCSCVGTFTHYMQRQKMCKVRLDWRHTNDGQQRTLIIIALDLKNPQRELKKMCDTRKNELRRDSLMSTDDAVYEFQSQIRIDPTVADGYMKHYVPIPDAIAAQLDADNVTHVEGTLDDVAFRRALHAREADVEMCLKFGMTWLKQADLAVGDPVTVILRQDPDPDRVDIPPELAVALAEDEDIAQFWETLAPSKRKTFVYGIERGKRAETRVRRAQKVVDDVRKLYAKRLH